MSVARTAASLGALSSKWLRKNFSYRKRAVTQLVRRSGFSEKMAGAMLDALFSEWTAPRINRMLRAELGDARVLDGFVRDGRNGRWVRAKGPATVLHIFSSNIPGAAVSNFMLGLLAGSRNVGKLSARDGGFLAVYLDSLKKHDRALAARCRLITSRGRAAAWAGRVGLVIAYGEDANLDQIRRQLPAKTPFIGYGHRVSVSLILRPGKKTARATAYDVWMADQRGCLSPAFVFVQDPAEGFAAHVARELERLEKSEKSSPRRALSDRIAVRRLHDTMRMAALRGEQARCWQGKSWAVSFDRNLSGEFSTGGQIIRIKGFSHLRDLEKTLQKMGPYLQGVALECAPAHRKRIAEWLSVFGVNRICRAGRLQHPPAVWHHDGKPSLSPWLQWTDLE